MNARKRKQRYTQIADKVFYALYAVEFLGSVLIGFLGNSFFAYQTFNLPWANILFLVLISLLYVTAFVQNMLDSHATGEVITNLAVFIGCMVAFALFYIFSGVFALCALVYAIATLIFIGCRYALRLRKDQTAQIDFKRVIATIIILLFVMTSLVHIKFANNAIFAWAFVPAAVVCVLAWLVAFALLRRVWTKIYDTKRESIVNAIAFGLIIFLLSYFCSCTVMGEANCVFDNEPTPVECVVLDKNVVAGARTVTQFEIKIELDGEERWIDVPVTAFHNIEEGDTVIIHYYKGALGFAYYIYNHRAAQQLN